MNENKWLVFLSGIAAGILVSAIYFDCLPGANYEFHSGENGQVLWRGDKKTGEVKMFTIGQELDKQAKFDRAIKGFTAPAQDLQP